MTVCALIDEDIHTYSALIHSFGEVAQNGKICQGFGPHYNPFGVSETFSIIIQIQSYSDENCIENQYDLQVLSTFLKSYKKRCLLCSQ